MLSSANFYHPSSCYRIDNNIQAAAFEVRTNGSTFDHPKQLHYIAVDQLDSLVKPLGGTPHSLKLETLTGDEKESDLGAFINDDQSDLDLRITEAGDDIVVGDVELDTVEEDVDVNVAPTSDDPEEWEAFLESQGLLDPEFDGDFDSEDIG